VEPFGGIVLAGGRSERMGRPKAELDWHGDPLVEVVCRTLERAGAAPVVVVRAKGQHLPPLPVTAEIVEDVRPARGPLEALAAGLRAIRATTELVFVSAVDAPFLVPAFVSCVVRAVEAATDAAVPVHEGRAHPLAAAYRVLPTLQAVERRLAGTDLSVRGLLDDLRVRRLDVAALLADPELRAADPKLDSLLNLNTPQDYADALARDR
jgi:molybdenum cofactor guanylyltransferase